MTEDTRASLRSHLQDEEGLRLKMYTDTEGVWTIGWGHAIGRIGISREIADALLDEDIDRAAKDLDIALPSWRSLDPVRQEVVVAMMFQLGFGTFLDFQRTRKAIGERRFSDASEHMLDSKWGTQTPNRVQRLAEMMRTGCHLLTV